MPSTNNLLALTAVLALTATLHPASTTVAAAKRESIRRKNRAERRLRRGQIDHVDEIKTKKAAPGGPGGLEEDVEFFTNLARGLQDMSVPGPTPTNPPVGGGPLPTIPPVIVDPFPPTNPPVGVDPTDPPVGGGPVPTLPPVVGPTPSGPPQPVAGIVCAQGETCTVLGDVCSDGSTEECCGEVFDSFTCECKDNGADLAFDCQTTAACADKVCETDPPAPGPVETPQPTVPQAGGFVCPALDICTAVDPANPVDECDVVGEPCQTDNPGEFCCEDTCRLYCTAKQAPPSMKKAQVEMLTSSTQAAFIAPMQNEWPGEN